MLMIPFDKPRHVGYCLSCYDQSGPIYSIPIDVTTEVLSRTLDRRSPINSEPLNAEEFRKIFDFVIGSMELSWSDGYEFLIQGMNLPLDWE